MKQICLATLLLLLGNSCATERRTANATNQERAVIQPVPSLVRSEPAKSLGPSEMILFNGRDLTGWKPTDFGGHGEVLIENKEIKILMGAELNGINWTNTEALPKSNYEIEMDAMKLEGNDFFCALTFPVGNSFCSLVVGGWGGGVVGISSVNGADASENDTTRNLYFEKNRWYHLKVRVTAEKILAWIDQENIVDLDTTGRRISMRGGEIEMSIPLGIATWQTSAAYKNMKLKTF